MLGRPIAAFDIETIPDPDAGRRLMGLTGDDLAVIEEMVRARLEEERLRAFVESIRGALRSEEDARWHEIAEALEGWPR